MSGSSSPFVPVRRLEHSGIPTATLQEVDMLAELDLRPQRVSNCQAECDANVRDMAKP
jgi:hypothetical protein